MIAVRPPAVRLALFAVLLNLAAACAPSHPSPSITPALPERLVLALDGLDYRDVIAAKERGLFASFRTPSRLISTFPSISDIAWHDIFGVLPPRGYQRIYYSNSFNSVLGAPLDAIRPIEFEERMDMAFGGRFHHLSAYIASGPVAQGEIDDAVTRFFEIRGRRTAYVYNVGPDALQHTRGDLGAYLRHLDVQLTTLQQEYGRRTGKSLEIVLLSDHGHNKAADAKFIPLGDLLRARGFHTARQLRAPSDIAFSVDGVTTGFGIFCHVDSIDALATFLSTIEGMDVVTAMVTPDKFRVRSRTASAIIQRRISDGQEVFSYQSETGDPLQYLPIIAQMRANHALPSSGFTTEKIWTEYSRQTAYPAALSRIVHGHTTVTLNTAPVLASVRDGYQVGLGTVSVANRLRPFGGTHGALSATNSLGVLMTNFRDTHDDVTTNIRTQLDGFNDMVDPFRMKSGVRVATLPFLLSDRFDPFHFLEDSLPAVSSVGGLEVWLSDSDATFANEPSLQFLVELRRHDRDVETTVRTSRSAASEWVSTGTPRRYFTALARIGLTALEPNSLYTLHIAMRQSLPASSLRKYRTRELPLVQLRSDAVGELRPF